MVFLAILFPPLAVLFTGRFGSLILNIILTLMFWIPGAIHAVVVVLDVKNEKRHKELLRSRE